jgi:hypothetical protein
MTDDGKTIYRVVVPDGSDESRSTYDSGVHTPTTPPGRREPAAPPAPAPAAPAGGGSEE